MLIQYSETKGPVRTPGFPSALKPILLLMLKYLFDAKRVAQFAWFSIFIKNCPLSSFEYDFLFEYKIIFKNIFPTN